MQWNIFKGDPDFELNKNMNRHNSVAKKFYEIHYIVKIYYENSLFLFYFVRRYHWFN